MSSNDERLGLANALRAIPIDEQYGRDYLDEAIECFLEDHHRASIVLLWNVFMYIVYKKINDYGLHDFVKSAKSKNMKFQGGISNLHDLNKLKDSDVLSLCHDLGFYDQNVKGRLLIHLGTRHSFAHLTQVILSRYTMFEFASDVIEYSKLIISVNLTSPMREPNLDTTYLERLQQMDEPALLKEIRSLEYSKLKNVITSLFDRIVLITEYPEYEESKNYYEFIILSMQQREKESERIELFDRVFSKFLIAQDVPITSDFLDVLPGHLKLSYIKNHVLTHGYLDYLIRLFINSGSYDTAGRNSEILLGFVNKLNQEQVESIANAVIMNDQLHDSFRADSKIRTILKMHRDYLSKDTIRNLNEVTIKI